MHKQRLEQMVTMLQGLPPEGEVGFNLETWHCGTTACAVGHACLNPAFNAEGLHLTFGGTQPEFEGNVSWDAVEAFFNLQPSQAEHLFSDWRYTTGMDTTPDQVADRIAEFIAVQ